MLTTPPREKQQLRNIHKARCFLWRQSNPEVNYSPLGSLGMTVSRRGITQQEKGHLLGTWNVRGLYRAGSFTAAARELVRYKLNLVVVQDIRWDIGGTVSAGDYNFAYGK